MDGSPSEQARVRSAVTDVIPKVAGIGYTCIMLLSFLVLATIF